MVSNTQEKAKRDIIVSYAECDEGVVEHDMYAYDGDEFGFVKGKAYLLKSLNEYCFDGACISIDGMPEFQIDDIHQGETLAKEVEKIYEELCDIEPDFDVSCAELLEMAVKSILAQRAGEGPRTPQSEIEGVGWQMPDKTTVESVDVSVMENTQNVDEKFDSDNSSWYKLYAHKVRGNVVELKSLQDLTDELFLNDTNGLVWTSFKTEIHAYLLTYSAKNAMFTAMKYMSSQNPDIDEPSKLFAYVRRLPSLEGLIKEFWTGKISRREQEAMNGLRFSEQGVGELTSWVDIAEQAHDTQMPERHLGKQSLDIDEVKNVKRLKKALKTRAVVARHLAEAQVAEICNNCFGWDMPLLFEGKIFKAKSSKDAKAVEKMVDSRCLETPTMSEDDLHELETREYSKHLWNTNVYKLLGMNSNVDNVRAKERDRIFSELELGAIELISNEFAQERMNAREIASAEKGYFDVRTFMNLDEIMDCLLTRQSPIYFSPEELEQLKLEAWCDEADKTLNSHDI